jgi:predicted Zn-dependent protease
MRSLARLRLLTIAALFSLLALGACSVNPATGRSSFTGLMSTADEQRVGAAEHPKLVRAFGGAYDDARLAAYVQSVGQSLARVTETPDQSFRFTVLNDDTVNAFALPGGYIHLSRGLLALADNEAEVAGVLAHEMGHVVARHSAERYSQAVAADIGAGVLGAVAAAAGLPPAVGDLAAAGAQVYVQSYSRDQELEADELAVRYLTRAGYDPRALATFLAKLDAQTRIDAAAAGRPAAADRHGLLSSHPRTTDRVRQAITLAGAPAGAATRTDRDDHLRAIDGLVYGDDPGQGVVRGREFQHPALGIGFTVPPGFALANRPDRLTARGPRGALMVFDVAPAAAARSGGDPAVYVARDWGGRLGLASVQQFQAAGLPGATGAARVNTKGGPVDVRLVAIRDGPDRIYRFLFTAPPGVLAAFDPAFESTARSFRRLSAAERNAVKPLRIRVVAVGAGDTPASLAARSAFGDQRLTRFLVLNGLAADARLEPGHLVKIVR